MPSIDRSSFASTGLAFFNRCPLHVSAAELDEVEDAQDRVLAVPALSSAGGN
jgi:hypothetical protein